MFSSDESLEGGVPSDLPPEKKKRRPRHKATTLTKVNGRPRMLTFAERVEAWHEHTLGAGIAELSIKYETSILAVQEALETAAQELGYPENHIDPELERFKIVTAADQMKSAQVKLLQDSNETLKSIKKLQQEIRHQREEIVIDSKSSKDEINLLKELTQIEAQLELRKQLEVKSAISIMAEYRATNLVIADLTGIKRTKPVRKPKQVKSAEQLLDEANLSTEQLIELAQSDGD